MQFCFCPLACDVYTQSATAAWPSGSWNSSGTAGEPSLSHKHEPLALRVDCPCSHFAPPASAGCFRSFRLVRFLHYILFQALMISYIQSYRVPNTPRSWQSARESHVHQGGLNLWVFLRQGGLNVWLSVLCLRFSGAAHRPMQGWTANHLWTLRTTLIIACRGFPLQLLYTGSTLIVLTPQTLLPQHCLPE